MKGDKVKGLIHEMHRCPHSYRALAHTGHMGLMTACVRIGSNAKERALMVLLEMMDIIERERVKGRVAREDAWMPDIPNEWTCQSSTR